MKVGSLFSGIGGIDLGLERAGMRIVWQCESDPFCRAVLHKHWPEVPCWKSVERLLADAERGSVQRVDVLCGGFPCQPVSLAGPRKGTSDERWLWPHFAGVIRLLRPDFVLVENVPGLLVRGMGELLGDLAALGFDAEWDSFPAAALGAPHRRNRVWIVADARSERRRQDAGSPPSDERANGRQPHGDHLANGDGESGGAGAMADADGGRRDGRPRYFAEAHWGRESPDGDWWAIEPDVGRVAYGVPARVDKLRALGNAVVPQAAEWIGRRIVSDALSS